jgi:hypothetical protein
MWCVGLLTLTKTLVCVGGPGFDPHGLHKPLNKQPLPKNGVPRGSPRLGHVAPNHLTKYATCPPMIHPNCQLSIDTSPLAMSAVVPLPRQLYGLSS